MGYPMTCRSGSTLTFFAALAVPLFCGYASAADLRRRVLAIYRLQLALVSGLLLLANMLMPLDWTVRLGTGMLLSLVGVVGYCETVPVTADGLAGAV